MRADLEVQGAEERRSLARVVLWPHSLPGALITFSGVDGSGKTTTLASVASYLRGRGLPVETLATPSRECRALDDFRAFAEDPTRALKGEIDLTALCVICLGDRLMTLRKRILPLLRRGVWVLCDRYVYTSLAELLAVGCAPEDLAAVRAIATRFPAPDLAILTAVDAEMAIERIRSRVAERHLPIDRTLFGRIAEAFLTVARLQGLYISSTDKDPAQVRARLEPTLDHLIRLRRQSRPGGAGTEKVRRGSFRAVLFDLFGTLVPMFSFSRYERVIAEMSELLEVSHEAFRHVWVSSFEDRSIGRFRDSGENLRWACVRLGSPPEDERIAAAWRCLRDFTRQSLVTPPSHLSYLDRLRRRGFRLGLVSNCTPDVPDLWSETPLAEHFDATCFSCTVGEAKPSPSIYLDACRALEVEPEECLYVGDGSDRELSAARHLGMGAVLLESSTRDAYDVTRHDVEAWDGAAVGSLEAIDRLLRQPRRTRQVRNPTMRSQARARS